MPRDARVMGLQHSPSSTVLRELNQGSFAETKFIQLPRRVSHPEVRRGPERSVAFVAWKWRFCKMCHGGDPSWNVGCGTGLKTHVRLRPTGLAKYSEMQTSPQDTSTKRKKALVLHEDPSAGFRLADWFAEHGYQMILSRRIDDIQPHLEDILPDIIVVDCLPTLTTTSDALPRRFKPSVQPSRLSL